MEFGFARTHLKHELAAIVIFVFDVISVRSIVSICTARKTTHFVPLRHFRKSDLFKCIPNESPLQIFFSSYGEHCFSVAESGVSPFVAGNPNSKSKF